MPALNNTSPPVARIIRMRALTERVGLSKSEIYRRIKDGSFVKPISLGPRAVGWLESDVDAYIDSLTRTRAS